MLIKYFYNTKQKIILKWKKSRSLYIKIHLNENNIISTQIKNYNPP